MEYPDYKLTVRMEQWRSIFFGPYAAIGSAQFLLYVALEHFHAPGWGKSLIAASAGLGMLLNPVIFEFLKRLHLRMSKAVALTVFAAAACFIPAVLVHDFTVFLPCAVAAVCVLSGLPTLVTAMWRNNVPPEFCGKQYSRVSLIGAISALASGGILALLFRKNEDTQYYYCALLVVAVSMTVAACMVWRIPGKASPQPKAIPFSNLSLLWKDKLFAWICFAWFFLGLGHLSVFPLRVEYMASPEYGLQYSAALVLIIMQVIPQIFRLGSTMIWGRIFDRANLMHVRLAINFFFFASILLFFFPPLICKILGMVCLGLANAGGELMWNLWVTRVAPPERTGDYMSVHVFLCGVRAVGGPVLAYYLLNFMPLSTVIYISAGLILLSSLLFLPLLRHPRIVGGGCCSQ